MKAVQCTKYGAPEVLKLIEVEIPKPQADELLIRVYATAVNSGDVRIRKADPWAVRLFFGFKRPKNSILGGVFSGEVVAAGRNVQTYKIGDLIFGTTGMTFGTYAEYLTIKETATIASKPDSLNHTEAAVIPFGAMTALYFIRKAEIQPGQKVLIYGASGAIGSAAVQLAKYYGAEVTAVCSGSNMELMRKIGADKVLNYQQEGLSLNQEKYDVVYETVNKLSFRESRKHVKKGGIVILVAANFSKMLRAGITGLFGQKIVTGVAKESGADMKWMKELIDEGKFVPVIDRSFSLEELVEAHRYVDLGHKKGNVVVPIVKED
ncbi:Zinc-type alcohol dehydrogenase-like protein [compost metagenome]